MNLILGLSISSTVQASGYDKILKGVAAAGGKHSYCYVEPKNKELKGSNLDGKVKLASVTKLLTSYWAIKRLGPNYRFKTDVSFDRSNSLLYIGGDSDPFFGLRRLHYLISELNKQGVHQVDEVRLGKNFSYFRGIDSKVNFHAEYVSGIEKSLQIRNLTSGLNVNAWTRDQENSYQATLLEAQKNGIEMVPLSKLRLSVKEVSFNGVNTISGQPGVINLVSFSPPLKDYLKYINMFSINYPADLIFDFLGGESAFAEFISSDLGLKSDGIKIYEGSGLPRHSTTRLDGYSTCRNVIEIISSMEAKLNQSGYDLTDVMMIAGVDKGTLGTAYATDSMRGSTIAKTGTLNSAITLAGYVNTEEGKVFFGIFFQTSSLSAARAARDRLVREFAMDHGGAKAVKEKKAFIFLPFDSQAQLQQVQASGGLN